MSLVVSVMKPRRKFIQSVGVSGVIGLAGCMSIGKNSEGEENPPRPDFDGYLDHVDGGYEDHRGNSEVTVTVGAAGNGGHLAFEPAGLWIDPGTTVSWVATGEGGGHSVRVIEPPGDMDLTDFSSEYEVNQGFTTPVRDGITLAGFLEEGETHQYQFTEEENGITKYECGSHHALDHLGAIAVGEDVPTTTEYETN